METEKRLVVAKGWGRGKELTTEGFRGIWGDYGIAP